MSNSNQSGSPEFDLDLDVHFLPAWAQRSSTENKYAQFEGGGEARRREPWEGRSAPRGPSDRRRERPAFERSPGRDSGRRREGPRPFQEGREYGGAREERREPAIPPVQLNVSLLPEEKGAEALARQIRLTGRAYPLFDIGQLILRKPDRYDVEFSVIKGADEKPAQSLYVCDLDETLWLSDQEAMDHVLSKHFSTFYRTEKIPTDPPKGVYTFVSQCGMSGTILGPPNYHDYQNKLRKLHQERFARLPFEVFKSRVKIVKDEAVVKKWVEEQSFRFEYTCLNVPETIMLKSRGEVEKHFRETHLANVVKSVERHRLSGPAAQNQPNRILRGAVRCAWEEQSRFPLKLVHALSQQFSKQGLQFFKLNKNVTLVAVARPRYLDVEATPVSENVQRIVGFVHNTPRCTRRKLLEALSPAAVAPPQPEPSRSGPEPLPTTEAQQSAAGETSAVAPVARPAGATHMDSVSGDLHWLIHEGHVIEFANGILELARKPAPKPPPKLAKKPEEAAKLSAQPHQTEKPAVVDRSEDTESEATSVEEGLDSTAAPDGAVISKEPELVPLEAFQAEHVNVSLDSNSDEDASSQASIAEPSVVESVSARNTTSESESALKQSS